MNRLLVLVFLAMAAAICMVGCGGNSQAKGVAELLTALANKIDTSQLASPSPSALPIPNQVSCNDDIYVLDSTSTLTINESAPVTNPSGAPTGYSQVLISMSAQLNPSGPGLSTTATTTATTDTSDPTSTSTTTTTTAATYAMTCGFSASIFRNNTSNRLGGVPAITDCANYECIVNGKKVECADVNAALKTLSAAGGCL